MNAPFDILAHRNAERARIRRRATFAGMQEALRSLADEAERISMLGNDEGATALARFRKTYELIGNQAASLHAEFVELGELDHEQRVRLEHSRQHQGNHEHENQ